LAADAIIAGAHYDRTALKLQLGRLGPKVKESQKCNEQTYIRCIELSARTSSFTGVYESADSRRDHRRSELLPHQLKIAIEGNTEQKWRNRKSVTHFTALLFLRLRRWSVAEGRWSTECLYQLIINSEIER
jgi:hypothetical protein